MKHVLAVFLELLMLLPCASAEEIWSPRVAPPVHAAEDSLQSVLEQGQLMYTGQTNKGWYPGEIAFLQNAQPDDYVILHYACDDKNHGDWHILTVNVQTASGKGRAEIHADKANPEQTRILVYTVKELMDMTGAASPQELMRFSVLAWNGGRIVSAHFLSGDSAARYRSFGNDILHTYTGKMSNQNAIPEARNVYAYIQSIWGKACLTGQMESTWMGTPDHEMILFRSIQESCPLSGAWTSCIMIFRVWSIAPLPGGSRAVFRISAGTPAAILPPDITRA